MYISTANCFGFGDKTSLGDETRPACFPFTNSLYARSKMEAQEMLLRLKHLMDVVIVNPTFMLGAYGTKKGSGQIVLRAYGHKIVFCPSGGKSFINAADAGIGVVKALEHGTNGEAYLLSGENLSYKEFYRRLSRVTGKRASIIVLPNFILSAVGVIGNLLKTLKIPNQFTLNNMKILCVRNYYTNIKATKELGLKIGSVDRGIAETIDRFQTKGIIKNKQRH